jgi:hypothetical protein
LRVGEILTERGIPLRIDNDRFHISAFSGEEPGPGNDWV